MSFSYRKSPQTSPCKKKKCWYASNLALCASACTFKCLLLRCWSEFRTFVWTFSVAFVLLQNPAAYTLTFALAKEGH